jgi:hypothetical protein
MRRGWVRWLHTKEYMEFETLTKIINDRRIVESILTLIWKYFIENGKNEIAVVLDNKEFQSTYVEEIEDFLETNSNILDENYTELTEEIVKRDDGYYLMSKKTGRNLGGPYETREQALKRERQVQFFKHLKKKSHK